jgi:hypothetical protein
MRIICAFISCLMGLLMPLPVSATAKSAAASENGEAEESIGQTTDGDASDVVEDGGFLEQENDKTVVVGEDKMKDLKSAKTRQKKRVVIKSDAAQDGVYFAPTQQEPASLFAYRLSLPYSVRGASNLTGTGLNIMPSLGAGFGIESGFRFSPDSQFSITYGGDASIWASGRVVGNTVVNVREELLGVTLRGLFGPRWGTPNHSAMAYLFVGGLGAFGHSMTGVSALAGVHPVAQIGGHVGIGVRIGLFGVDLGLDGSTGVRNPLPSQFTLEQIGTLSIGYRF